MLLEPDACKASSHLRDADLWRCGEHCLQPLISASSGLLSILQATYPLSQRTPPSDDTPRAVWPGLPFEMFKKGAKGYKNPTRS